ncbi:MAG: acetoin utilization protein AcuC [Aeromicrobium sp.]
MPARPTLVWSDSLTDYNLGPDHPLAPIRVALAIQLARELGVLDRFDIVEPRPLTVDELATVHAPYYISGVQELSEYPYESDPALGLGTGDNPVFHGMHDASALVAGATVEAARRVWTGETKRAANIAGGLHHAMPNRASGFCVYNDPALAIRWMLDHGAERVAYVDVDAHHGDGVQAIFYDDPRVLTVSIHEGPRTLFPGTGYPDETGGPGAEGSAVNIALPPGTTDAGWLRAFHAVVPPVVEAFAPQVLLSQHGCDSHAHDPLTNLALSIDGQRASYLAVERLAEEHAGGNWIVTGGGGYALYSVVPRVWTHLLAIVAGRALDPLTATPPTWRDDVARISGRPAESAMTDGVAPEYRSWIPGAPDDNPVDRAIQATLKAVFPLMGLEPNG